MSNVGVSVGSDLLSIWQILMIAERFKDGLFSSKDQEMMVKMDGELTKVIEDFDRAVNIEALRQAKETGKHSLSLPRDSYSNWLRVDEKLLLERLKSVEAGHDSERGCMEGTRQAILHQILDSEINPQDNN